jgi:F420H(2)-dependent quinone reductase
VSWVDRTRPLWRAGNRWEVMLLRRFGTSGMSLLRRSPLLVLETTGRRTGRRRAAPVAFWEDGGEYFVGGGAAGMSRVDWVANVRADPHAEIVVRRRRLSVAVTELSGDDYDQARAHALTLWPSIPKYERMSGRRVPYFRLTPFAR